MKQLVFLLVGLLLLFFFFGGCGPKPEESGRLSGVSGSTKIPILIASYAETPRQAEKSLMFADSLRTFAGSLKDTPIRLYLSDQLPDIPALHQRLAGLGVEFKIFHIPETTRGFILAGKPAAAALAEREAEGEAEILAFLDTNVLVFRDPEAFRLAPETDFAYRPVFHQNVGSLYDQPVDPYWARIYSLLEVDPSVLFPMQAAADKRILRPYYNAGFLVVRPERGLLRKWADNFAVCAGDAELIKMCEEQLHNVFLHQAALSATVPVHLPREKTLELPAAYNSPLFFHKFYPSEVRFDSLEDVVSIKVEFNFSDLPAGWDQEIAGPAEVIDWIKRNCAAKTDPGEIR